MLPGFTSPCRIALQVLPLLLEMGWNGTDTGLSLMNTNHTEFGKASQKRLYLLPGKRPMTAPRVPIES